MKTQLSLPSISPKNIFALGSSRAFEAYQTRTRLWLSKKAAKINKETPAKAGVAGAQPASGIKPSPAHDLIYHGGKIIEDLTFQNLYLGGASRWKKSDITNIDSALSAAMMDKNLNNVIVQYFSSGRVSSTSKLSQVLPGSIPDVVGIAFLEQTIIGLFDKGALDGFDLGSTVFNFMLPSGAVLTDTQGRDKEKEKDKDVKKRSAKRIGLDPDDKVNSLEGLGGYHGSVHIPSGNGKGATVYYAAGAYSEKQSNGSDNGIVAFADSWKNVVATFYHELQEARTDADVDDVIATNNVKLWGWADKSGSEIGDFPIEEVGNDLTKVFQEVPLTSGGQTVPIQMIYSNFVHGPEGPTPQPRPFAGKPN